MKIEIDKKYRPFSQSFGERALIPKSGVEVQAFPGKLNFVDRTGPPFKEVEIFFGIKRPIDKFFIFQDLEKKRVEVSFFMGREFFRYQIFLKSGEILIFLKRGNDLLLTKKNRHFHLKRGESFSVMKVESEAEKNGEKLFLGVSKKQDIALILRRRDLREILPLIFSLSKLVPSIELSGRFPPLKTERDFLSLIETHFLGMFSPTLEDVNYLGGALVSGASSPLFILKKMDRAIRDLFILEGRDYIHLLPSIFKSFHSGRFLNLETKWGGLDIRWSKKILKGIIFRSKRSSSFRLRLQSKIESFRVRGDRKDRGRIYSASDILSFKKDKLYIIDRFSK